MVDIEIKLTIDSVKSLDPETISFIRLLAKECKSLKVESSTSQPTPNPVNQKYKTPIQSLKTFGLSTIAINCLKNHRIHYIEDIANFSPDNLLQIRHFGTKSLKELLIVIQKWQETEHDQDIEKWLKLYRRQIDQL